MAAPSGSSSPPVRSWRTTFLTLRDEALTSTSRSTVVHLLNNLIFSQSETLIAAAPSLSAHEVTSDTLFLMELARTLGDAGGKNEDTVHTSTQLIHLIHSLSRRISFELNSSTWAFMLDFFGRMVETFPGEAGRKRLFLGNIAVNRAIKQCLDIIRCHFSAYQRTCSLAENVQLLNFLLCIVACSEAELYCLSHSSGHQKSAADFVKRIPGYNSSWENQIIIFTMICEIFSRVGPSLPVEIWQSTIEVLRKVMDVFSTRGLLVENTIMARFYISLLHCLHFVLKDPKKSLADHVAGFVAALRMFFNYGLTNKFQTAFPEANHRGLGATNLIVKLAESDRSDSGPYRPPHLRRKERKSLQLKDRELLNFADNESSKIDTASSDSDYSDSDGSTIDAYNFRSPRVRVAAIICIQDLCRADPKSFTAQWTMLLPSSDVLGPKKYEATLLTCFIFDPCIKVRIASASTLATMLDGPASVFLQVAEFKEPSKCGSFTALSSTLGQILMQLHIGILYLMEHETNNDLLVSVFKSFIVLISSTPYSRMPAELLPRVISSLQSRIEQGFPFLSDQTGLLVVAINCLTAALSASPSSVQVQDMLVMEVSTGFVDAKEKSAVLSTIFRYSELVTNPAICFEALQALRAVAHNYPTIAIICWEQIFCIVFGLLGHNTAEVLARQCKGNVGNTVAVVAEKVITSAVKVLDECLRAISGFKGTEDLLDDKLFDNPFTSDYIKLKTISSAPSYGSHRSAVTVDEPGTCLSEGEQWCDAIQKHMPLILGHTSSMVRAAAVTCFAGMTSSVFFSLPKEKQGFIITASINAALIDEVPSVRSAACRVIGVMACFPQIFQSAEILDKFVHAIEINTRNPLTLVRITASWALANICDSLRFCINDLTSEISIVSRPSSALISLLMDCTLRLTKDGDKIKANAVRALGNLSRFVRFSSQSGASETPADCIGSSKQTNGGENSSASCVLGGGCREHLTSNLIQPISAEDLFWLEQMVQAFLSCITTGNVKVQWNACHALSNLFLNETLNLQDMDWAPSVFSILLLLLRDSSNFKIRIQAASALAVPATITDYGRSFSDIVQGVEHVLENLHSDRISTPSSFKYKIALEKQLTATLLHVLALASRTDLRPVKDFLVKKASFLEEWLKVLCSSLFEASTQVEVESSSVGNQKKLVVSEAIRSLIEVYEDRNQHVIAQRFDNLAKSIL